MLRALARQNSPITLSQSGVPVGIPSSGSIGNNGALTLTTALPTTYAGIYLYFPANAIFTGSAAGLYYCVMSSATVGTIYNNTYSSGDPTIPTSPTALVTTGPGAYTQSTSEITARSVTIPGGMLGARGASRTTYLASGANTANTKTPRVRFAGNAVQNGAFTTGSTNAGNEAIVTIWNRSTASQIACNSVPGTGNANSILMPAVDTSVDQALTVTAQLANAADYIIIEAATIEVLPS